jgi:hippurate hydrolase
MILETKTLEKEMLAWRQDFHQHPELGFEEFRTSEKIAAYLESFGIQVFKNFGSTGIVGILKKGNSKKIIAIRADMDALPISELTGLDYESVSQNKMHACGHDGHMAILLGTAKFLADDSNYNGTIVFIFQPNEENGLGAKAMIKDGLFSAFNIDEVFALHNLPGMEIGTFATKQNVITASESCFEIEILTEGGHSALPHLGSDSIVIASEVIGALQTIISRKIDPRAKAVFSITEIFSNGKRNVLPSSVTIKGDTRTIDDSIKNLIEENFEKIVKGICSAHSAKAKLKFETFFPVTINSKIPTQNAIKCIEKTFGSKKLAKNFEAMPFSEDFSYMAQECPGCFILMGNGLTGANSQPLHSAKFDFCDQGLVWGSSFWVSLAKQIS